ncbi:hypothetical protein DYI81_09255 [Acinetobacter sp. SWAC5]|uniref:hypothetical protein n=1 Tax=Acinetobacter sp. SWAC5 TaxID=2293835 RepID=UPI000E343F7A|nr:hypothetical protein [Acinetobacter sp. SWAC5]RFS30995.1 hypothetical protein DYI81_09255 [Acinetobacter sp. SWAC5]
MHHINTDDGVKHYLFYNVSKIVGLVFLDKNINDLFDINEKERLVQLEHAWNISVHELGHVHFNNRLLALNSKVVLEKDFDTRNLYTRFHHATQKACINEYLACLYASSSISINQPETYRSLQDNVLIHFNDCPNEVENAFKKFYQTGNYAVLMNKIYMPITVLLKSCSYFLGHIHGLNQNFTGTDLYRNLQDTWFIDHILQLEEILSDAYDKIRNDVFEDSDLNRISRLLDDIANLFGINAAPTQDQDDVYVTIIG